MDTDEILTMEDCMTLKPVSIGPDEPVAKALGLMFKHGIRHLPVVDGDLLIGMVSDRDIRQSWGRTQGALKVTGDADLRETVSEIMSHPAIDAGEKTPVQKAVELMVRHRIGALPVVDPYHKLIGIFTETDALQYCLILIERYQKKPISY